MTLILDAVYEAGTIRLVGKPVHNLSEGQHVKVMVEGTLDEDRADMMRLGLSSLVDCYGDDEPEYGLDDLKVVNPHYARG